MILTYAYTAVGSSHVKSGTGNQDAMKVGFGRNGGVVAAVADGVGSSKHSDIAAAIAVEVSVQVCLYALNNGYDLLESVEKAFAAAQNKIEARVLLEEHLVTDYDTTLTLVVYDGKNIVYGHSGDGGIAGVGDDRLPAGPVEGERPGPRASVPRR